MDVISMQFNLPLYIVIVQKYDIIIYSYISELVQFYDFT